MICGVDESGRGPLAGPVTAAAVILPKFFPIEKLNDSKKMTERARIKMFDILISQATWGFGWVGAEKIDEINILQASLLAMRIAFDAISVYPITKAYIDGNRTAGLPITEEAVIGGDRIIHEVMAASILAKTVRDRFMQQLHYSDPRYGFDQHKGYPTVAHRLAIDRYGLSVQHRLSFRYKKVILK